MTRWQPDERAKAIGLALAIGADKASAQTGIPRRTISSWISGERPAPELQAAISQSRDDVAARLWEAVTVGTDQVLAGLRDPKARLGDKANALRIVAEQYQLITGAATARTESYNANVSWSTPEYEAASQEVKWQADDFLRQILHEVMAGQQALRLAGAADSTMTVDGLTVRAKLEGNDESRVRYLLREIDTKLASGVPATEIVDSLGKPRTDEQEIPHG